MKKYDIIYSIGHDCACATYLKRTNLRIKAGPLDWVGGPNFKERIDLIINGFQDFFAIDYYEPMPRTPENDGVDKVCDYYRNTKINLLTMHDFPRNIPLKDSVGDVKRKFDKRAERFYKKLKTKDKILLVWFSFYHETPDEDVIESCKKLCDYYGKTIDFLIIEHKEGVLPAEKVVLADNITRYNLHLKKTKPDGNFESMGNEEVCKPIFEQYDLTLSNTQKFYNNFLKTSVRFIAFFIPNKKLRANVKIFFNSLMVEP